MVKTSSLSFTTREYWIVEGRMKKRSKKQPAALSILVPQELTGNVQERRVTRDDKSDEGKSSLV